MSFIYSQFSFYCFFCITPVNNISPCFKTIYFSFFYFFIVLSPSLLFLSSHQSLAILFPFLCFRIFLPPLIEFFFIPSSVSPLLPSLHLPSSNIFIVSYLHSLFPSFVSMLSSLLFCPSLLKTPPPPTYTHTVFSASTRTINPLNRSTLLAFCEGRWFSLIAVPSSFLVKF